MAGRALASGTRSTALRLRAAEIFLRSGRRRAAQAFVNQVLACRAALTPGEGFAAERIRVSLAQAPPIL